MTSIALLGREREGVRGWAADERLLCWDCCLTEMEELLAVRDSDSDSGWLFSLLSSDACDCD